MEPIATSSLELITAPMTAGEPRTFYLSGQYFELVDAVNPVDVVLSDMYGSQRGLMRQAEASFFLKSTPFKVVQITSATTQTIRFGYGSGEGGTRRAAGSVTISSGAPLTDAQLRAAAVVVRAAELASNHFQSVAALLSNTPEVIIAPGSNLNGALILSMGSQSQSATSTNVEGFVAKTSAPATFTDGDVQAQAGMRCAVGTGFSWSLSHQQPILLPAGMGLYYISSLSMVASSAARHCRYKLL